jgi:hypothetical protein
MRARGGPRREGRATAPRRAAPRRLGPHSPRQRLPGSLIAAAGGGGGAAAWSFRSSAGSCAGTSSWVWGCGCCQSRAILSARRRPSARRPGASPRWTAMRSARPARGCCTGWRCRAARRLAGRPQVRLHALTALPGTDPCIQSHQDGSSRSRPPRGPQRATCLSRGSWRELLSSRRSSTRKSSRRPR